MADQTLTMKQIADLAGVHRSTVDKVIHNRPGVSEEQRKRIRQIIEISGYKPNQAGIALQNQSRTFMIDVFLMTVDAAPYIQQGIREAEESLDNFRIRVRRHLIDRSTPDNMLQELNLVLEQKDSDGIIIMPYNSPGLLDAIKAVTGGGIPVVSVNSETEDCGYLRYVGPSNITSGKTAAQLMTGMIRGRGEVAVITGSTQAASINSSTEIRQKAFQEYINNNCPEITLIPVLENHENYELTERLVIRLIEEHPDLKGIYCTTGGAYKVGEAVELTGRKGQITVITHELYPEILELIRRDAIFCTIGSELIEQGRMAMHSLMDYLLYHKEPDCRKHYTKSLIVIRENIDGSEP